MGKEQRFRGLYWSEKDGEWRFDKRIEGIGRVQGRFGRCEAEQAIEQAVALIERVKQEARELKQAPITFEIAAIKYLKEQTGRAGIVRDAQGIEKVAPYINHLELAQVHQGTLQPYIDAQLSIGRSLSTINRDIAPVRAILNLCARVWRHPGGQTWLPAPPLIQVPKNTRKRQPYPLSWAEQRLLLPELPEHLAAISLYALNSGCREHEIVGLRWEYEVRIPELDISLFLLPGQPDLMNGWHGVKSRQDRLVILNSVARSVVDAQRDKHPTHVFTYRGHPVVRANNNGWRTARSRAAEKYPEVIGTPPPWGFRNLRVHDLRHTVGRRLRAIGISQEDREDILGHSGGRMVTHYSAAEIQGLIRSLEQITRPPEGQKEVTLLRVIQK